MTIDSKSEFYRLWESGVLGNRTLLFHTIDEALASDVEVIGFRLTHRAAGGAGAWEKAPRDEARAVSDRWTAAGRRFIMDGSVPNDQTLMQGEVCRSLSGLVSFCCHGGPGLLPMRQTMAAGLHRHRGWLETKILLEHYLDPSSLDDVYSLLDLYPEATIELAAFACDVGVIPGRNTIIWEVRDY